MRNTVIVSSVVKSEFPDLPVYGMILEPQENASPFHTHQSYLLVIYDEDGLNSIGLVSLEDPSFTWDWTSKRQNEWDCSGLKPLPPGTSIKYTIGDWKNES